MPAIIGLPEKKMSPLFDTAFDQGTPGIHPTSTGFATAQGKPPQRQSRSPKRPTVTPQKTNIVDLLAMTEDVEFEPARLDVQFKPAQF